MYPDPAAVAAVRCLRLNEGIGEVRLFVQGDGRERTGGLCIIGACEGKESTKC